MNIFFRKPSSFHSIRTDVYALDVPSPAEEVPPSISQTHSLFLLLLAYRYLGGLDRSVPSHPAFLTCLRAIAEKTAEPPWGLAAIWMTARDYCRLVHHHAYPPPCFTCITRRCHVQAHPYRPCRITGSIFEIAPPHKIWTCRSCNIRV